jgi:hypothetical protein
MSDEKLAALLDNTDIPADVRILLFLPTLWINQKRGLPANLCVQACLTLRHAYGQLGIWAELRAVELVAREASGHVTGQVAGALLRDQAASGIQGSPWVSISRASK